MWAWSRVERASGAPGYTSSPLPFPESLTACCLLSLYIYSIILLGFPASLLSLFVSVGSVVLAARPLAECTGAGVVRRAPPPLSSPSTGDRLPARHKMRNSDLYFSR